MPPPSLFQDFFHQDSIIAFLNKGPEVIVCVSNRHAIASIDELIELGSYHPKNCLFLLFVELFGVFDSFYLKTLSFRSCLCFALLFQDRSRVFLSLFMFSILYYRFSCRPSDFGTKFWGWKILHWIWVWVVYLRQSTRFLTNYFVGWHFCVMSAGMIFIRPFLRCFGIESLFNILTRADFGVAQGGGVFWQRD